MRTYKKWSLLLLGILVLFIVLNGVIWTRFTRDILDDRVYHSGGLDRLGYMPESKHYRKLERTLPRRHIANVDYAGQPIELLVIGDSFSNDYENGKDPLYLDWVASITGKDVLNLQPLKDFTGIETLIVLINSGYLDTVRPAAVLIERVERDCVLDLARDLNFNARLPLAEIEEFYRHKKYSFRLPALDFINMANFKFLYYRALWKWTDRDLFSKVYIHRLDKPMFSAENNSLLLVYQDDVRNLGAATPRSLGKLNANLNRVAAMLAERGIPLLFMPSADKYNIYSGHIVQNPYPPSTFFELLRPLPRRYTLIDTKLLLREEVERGELDVYYSDDSHWSWKGSKKVAGEIARALKPGVQAAQRMPRE